MCVETNIVSNKSSTDAGRDQDEEEGERKGGLDGVERVNRQIRIVVRGVNDGQAAVQDNKATRGKNGTQQKVRQAAKWANGT